jgi:hypothetical protein
MRKSSICFLAIAAIAVASLPSSSANAQTHRTDSARAANVPAMSQRVRAAHAEEGMPSSTSMAADYSNAMHTKLLSDPICRPGGPVRLADGLHVCQ